MSKPTPRTNPYDYVGDVKDPSLFAGRRPELTLIRDELSALAAAQPTSPVMALVGERRVGKTSLLHRVVEVCTGMDIFCCHVNVTSAMAGDPGEFWFEVFQRLLAAGNRSGVITLSQPDCEDIGFKQGGMPPKRNSSTPHLALFSWYLTRSVTPSVPPASVVSQDFAELCEAFASAHYKGLLVMLDEAHLLAESLDIVQQLRYVLREVPRCGALFAGERGLNRMFTDPGAPFYLQALIIPVQNFAAKQEVAECALLPLIEAERLLMSPMTVDHLYRLSHGKPNQIRLICHSIYRRYAKGTQSDLNITIEALDDVLDLIQTAYTSEYDLKKRVDGIRQLTSVDVEALYLITRYPEWQARDVVDVDEAFRGERVSARAAARRALIVARKREKFIAMGLMQDHPEKYLLAGDEFLQLYLRFWYEAQKFGALRKAIDLGEGPPTPFGEKVDKLVRSLAWAVGRMPAMVMKRYSSSDERGMEAINRVRHRSAVLDAASAAGSVRSADEARILVEWFETCNLVGKAGPYCLLAVSVRNLDNPRESILLEIYFDGDEVVLFPLSLLTAQAEAARILVEAVDSWSVKLPTLDDLIKTTSGQTLNEVLERGANMTTKWMVLSLKKIVEEEDAGDDGAGKKDKDADDEDDPREWLNLYKSNKLAEAIELLTKRLAKNPRRPAAARIYNNLGYMKYDLKDHVEAARRDMERARDLHFFELPLTLLNLGVVAIDNGAFADAIQTIEDALLLTVGRESIDASFLRLRLLGGHLMFAQREKWEQHPANVLEAAYVNLGYALAREGDHDAARDVLEEGLELVPSSSHLRHALARLHLSQRRAQLADPLYAQLSDMLLSDSALAGEVRAYRRVGGRRSVKG